MTVDQLLRAIQAPESGARRDERDAAAAIAQRHDRHAFSWEVEALQAFYRRVTLGGMTTHLRAAGS